MTNAVTAPLNLNSIVDHTANEQEAQRIINKYTAIASGSALIPVPFLDLLTLGGIQLKMLQVLGKLHNYKFQDHAVKSIIGVLIDTLPAYAVVRTAGSLFKSIPIVGPILGGVTGFLYGAASTYALGKVFNMHFETGMTLLAFDMEKMKTAFREYYDEYIRSNAPAHHTETVAAHKGK